MNTHRGLLSVSALALVVTAPLPAQSLADRVRSAPGARVQFAFAARAGVCGDGQSFLSTGNRSSYYGRVSIVDGVTTQPCAAGPVRVVIDRADGVITNIETVAGPLQPAEGATDLGTVQPRDAAAYLMSIAATNEGRAARDAMLPAAIADGVDVSPQLVAIARDQNRPLDTRRGALSWLARDDDGAPDARVARASDVLLHIAQDENEAQPLRRHALDMLARVGRGAGVPALIRLAGNGSSWVADESIRALAQSGDPRAREFLRRTLQRSDLSDATLATVARSLSGNQATGQDVELLRNRFATLTGDRARSAILDAIAQRGTASDTQWLLGVARDSRQPLETRRRALELATRNGAGSTSAVSLYDTMDEPSLKEALIRVLAQSNDRASLDKLITIARTDSNYTLRRRAISALSKTQDARARDALAGIAGL
jgi:HEAT repeat protein